MNLKNLNLVELNAQELKTTEGGFWGGLGATVVGYMIISAMAYPKEFWKGFHNQ